MQPTSPLRSYEDINLSIKKVREKKYKSLFSVSESIEHPYESVKIFNNKKWEYVLNKAKKYYRRQDFDFRSYFINGAIYIIHKELIAKKKMYVNKNSGFFIMPKHRSIDVNDLEEVKIAESLIKAQ